MAYCYLDPQIRKSILTIQDKISDIENVLRDLSMKLCHIIRQKRSADEIYNDMLKGKEH